MRKERGRHDRELPPRKRQNECLLESLLAFQKGPLFTLSFSTTTTASSPSELLLPPLLAADFFEPFFAAPATTDRRAGAATERFVATMKEAGAQRDRTTVTAGAAARATIAERIAERDRERER